MADWALGVLIVSAATFAASVLGVYLVWLNLREARETTRNAQREADTATAALEHTRRPWLGLHVEKGNGQVRYNAVSNVVTVPVRLVVSNYGNSPAYFRAETIYVNSPFVCTPPKFSRPDFIRYAEHVAFPSETTVPGMVFTDKISPFIDEIGGAKKVEWIEGCIVCRVTYCTANGGDLFHTSRTVSWVTSGPITVFDTEDGWSAEFNLQSVSGPSANTAT